MLTWGDSSWGVKQKTWKPMKYDQNKGDISLPEIRPNTGNHGDGKLGNMDNLQSGRKCSHHGHRVNKHMAYKTKSGDRTNSGWDDSLATSQSMCTFSTNWDWWTNIFQHVAIMIIIIIISIIIIIIIILTLILILTITITINITIIIIIIIIIIINNTIIIIIIITIILILTLILILILTITITIISAPKFLGTQLWPLSTWAANNVVLRSQMVCSAVLKCWQLSKWISVTHQPLACRFLGANHHSFFYSSPIFLINRVWHRISGDTLT